VGIDKLDVVGRHSRDKRLTPALLLPTQSTVIASPLRTLALDGVYSSLIVLTGLNFSFAVGNSQDPLIKTFFFEEEEEEEEEDSLEIKGGPGRILSWSAGEAFTLLEEGSEGVVGLGTSSMMLFGESLVVGGCDGKIRIWQNIKDVVRGGGG